MSRRKSILYCGLALLLIAGIASLQYFRRSHEYVSDQFLMDTLISIKVYGKDPETLRKAVDAAYAEMRRIAELSDGFPQPGTAAFNGSDVCRINAQAGRQPVRVDGDILAMLLLAKKYNELSEGAIDVTVGPLMDLWGFAEDTPRVPPPDRIRAALALVDSKDLLLNERERTAFLRRAGMKLDMGAVAKGYATEKALQVLKNHGITQALLDAGGNIRVLGRNTFNAPWRIGIKDPRKSDAIAAILPLEDASAVTSGDYYRFFESGGKRYHHILDPRSGYPADRHMSVTVVTKDAGLADILSTVFFVLPPEKSLEMAEKMAGVELFLISADGRIRHTPSLAGRIEVKPGESYHYDQGR
jgi:thiamine biosynthesis lipoprotein